MAYAVLSFAYFGRPLLPHPGRYLLGSGADPQIFVWSFAWWPHALLHGHNPFVTSVIWSPVGVDLAWATCVPALAIPLMPLTLAAGPVVAYNVAALLVPALAAWTAFLLCRYLGADLRPSLVGGYLFGFSGYMLGQELGHLNLSAIFLLPLVALTVLRYLAGEHTRRMFVRRFGLLLALQLGISTEVAATLTLALAISLALAAVLVPRARPRLRHLLAPLAGGYGLAALLASPLLMFAALHFEPGPMHDVNWYGADLLNLVMPTHLVAVGAADASHTALRFPGNDFERGAYLGVPSLTAFLWYAIERRRDPVVRFLVAALLVTVVLALGTTFTIAGDAYGPAPWRMLAHLPLFDKVIPVRLVVYGTLLTAVVTALWLTRSSTSRGLRSVLAALAVITLVPSAWTTSWRLDPQRPAFFARPGLAASCLPRGGNVLAFPYAQLGFSTLWQAESGFSFRLAGGYVTPQPPSGFPLAMYFDQSAAGIRRFVRDQHVDAVVSVAGEGPSAADLRALGPVQTIGGVAVWPPCGDARRSS